MYITCILWKILKINISYIFLIALADTMVYIFKQVFIHNVLTVILYLIFNLKAYQSFQDLPLFISAIYMASLVTTVSQNVISHMGEMVLHIISVQV